MSGQQIGSTIGAIVGSYFGPVGQAIGAAVGGYIGGVIDPTEIFGPRLTDALNQTARDGVPRAYGYGTFPCAGNIIWCSDLRERKNTEGGKGSTTETITYQYFRSYAIAVCEGPADGNGIAGFRIVKRNGKVVYDTRTDAELTSLGYSTNEIAETRAAQAKFTNKARFYYGISDQEPDPTIQAVKGSDDVPGYSYTAYMVVTDDDVTELRGAVPQYEFVVSVCGDRTEDYGKLLITGGGASGPRFTELDSQSLEFRVIDTSTGANVTDCVAIHNGVRWAAVRSGQARFASSLDDNWTTGTAGATEFSQVFPDGEDSFIAVSALGDTADLYEETSGVFTILPRVATNPARQSSLDASIRAFYLDGYWYSSYTGYLFRCVNPRVQTWDTHFDYSGGQAIRYFADLCWFGGVLYGCGHGSGSGTYYIAWSPDGGLTWPIENIVLTTPATISAPNRLVNVDGALVAYCVGGKLRCNVTGWVEIDIGIEGVEENAEDKADVRSRICVVGNRLFVLGDRTDSDKLVIFRPGDGYISDPITLPFPNAVGIAKEEFPTAGIPIPDAPGYFTDPVTGEILGPGGTTISQCAPSLAEIVEDQCALREVTAVDVSELEDDDVLGFRIANTSSPQKNILASQPGYFFDSSEFDGILHFPKRGGSDSFHIPFDEMVMREGETVQWERTQEAELLRKVTFTYFDPRATYTPTSQTGERRAGTIQAMGETASQLPLVGTGDWAAKAADINLKSAWYEPDECTFPVSLDWAELVPAAVGTIEDERGTIHRLRILDIKDDGLIRLVKARRTDSSAYQSNASGKPIPLPTFPGSDIRGPTTSSVFNIPAVLDSHDRPGIYWAATGAFTSWIGAVLQVQRAGQWVTLAQTVSGATVGTLVDDLPYHGGDIDNINTLSIRINSTLESVTYTQLLNERNPFVIAYPDGTGEIIQFQEAALDSDGVWNCTKLLRGRLNTREGLHLAGATIAALDSLIQFVDLRPDDLGKALLFRVVSSGTDPDSGTSFVVEFDRIWSSTEWEVAELEVVKDGDDFTVSWIPRHRLGTDVNPIRSGNWDGFLVRYQYSDQFFEEVITDTSKTYNLPGASDVEFTVFQLNRLTGAGPGVSVTHE